MRLTLDHEKTKLRKAFPDLNFVSTSKLAQWLEEGTDRKPILLDARTSAEFEVSHLPGAIRVGSIDELADVPKEAVCVFYCTVGQRAADQARHAARHGWTNVWVLDGSIFQWANEERLLVNAHGRARQVHPFAKSTGLLLRPDYRAPLESGVGALKLQVANLHQFKLGAAFLLFAALLAWETLAPAVLFIASASGSRTRHALRNFGLGTVNALLIALCFVQTWWWIANWAEANNVGLLHLWGMQRGLHLVMAILLLDLWTYLWHRLNHDVPFFWRFHRVHHSDLHVDVTSASRFHVGEIVVSSILRVPLIVLLGVTFEELLIYEILLFTVVQFQHANVRIPEPIDTALSWVFVTPGMHRVHHSRLAAETDSNFSSVLSCWDRLFGTWTKPRAVEYGLDEFRHPAAQTFSGMLLLPAQSYRKGGARVEREEEVPVDYSSME